MDAAAKPIACSDAATALNKAELLLRSPECTARPGALHGCLEDEEIEALAMRLNDREKSRMQVSGFPEAAAEGGHSSS